MVGAVGKKRVKTGVFHNYHYQICNFILLVIARRNDVAITKGR